MIVNMCHVLDPYNIVIIYTHYVYLYIVKVETSELNLQHYLLAGYTYTYTIYM